MRISALLFCTLATFIARELPHAAAAAPETPSRDPRNDAASPSSSFDAIASVTDTAITQVAIAPPEVMDVPFSPSANNEMISFAEPPFEPPFQGSFESIQFDNQQFHNQQPFAQTTSIAAVSRTNTTTDETTESPSQPATTTIVGDRTHTDIAQPFNNQRFATLNPTEAPLARSSTTPITTLGADDSSIEPLTPPIPEWSTIQTKAQQLPDIDPSSSVLPPSPTVKAIKPISSHEQTLETISADIHTTNIDIITTHATDQTREQSPVLISQIETVAPPVYIPHHQTDTTPTPNRPPTRPPKRVRVTPALTLANPSGFGAHDNTIFIGASYQERTRFANSDDDDGTMVIGVGLGDARETVGVQLSYTLASFGGSRDFGDGGFNAKVHRQLPGGWGVALGWEGFITTNDNTDFEDTVYGSVTHLIRSRERLSQPFSRIAITAGAGTGRFRSEEAVENDRSEIGAFGSLAVRIAEPVGAVVEWTGQDLAAGISITPFKNIPIVFTPAVRDITGAGDGARFVFGTGAAFKF